MKINLHTRPKILTPASQEYKNLSRIKWLNLIGILTLLSIFIGSLWFVYTNIYQTIGKVQILLVNNQNLNFEPIDFKLYYDTVSVWNSRKDLPPLTTVRDPFYEVAVTTSTGTNTQNAPYTNSIQGQL